MVILPQIKSANYSLMFISITYIIQKLFGSGNFIFAEIQQRISPKNQAMIEPFGMPFGASTICRRPSLSSAERIIPWLTCPRIFRGFKLETITTFCRSNLVVLDKIQRSPIKFDDLDHPQQLSGIAAACRRL